MQNRPAIILGGHYGALSIARSLGRNGITVYCHDKDPHAVAFRSKYVRKLAPGSDKSALLSTLKALSLQLHVKPVLYVSADTYLAFVADHLNELQQYVVHPYQEKGLVDALLDKVKSAHLFEDHDLATPQTWLVDGTTNRRLKDLPAPMVMKPVQQTDWTLNREALAVTNNRKALFLDDPKPAQRLTDRMVEYGPLILQEYVPGGDGDLFYFIGYRDADGRMLVAFSGRKLKTLQDGMGSETVLQSDDTSDVLDLGRRVFDTLNIIGSAGVDIKRNPDTGRLYVIEVNYRFGLSDGIVQSCGIDLAMIYYRQCLGEMIDPIPNYRLGVIWVWLEHELARNAKSIRKFIAAMIQLGVAGSRGRLMINEFRLLDPMPFVDVVWRRAVSLIRKGAKHA